MRLTRVHRAWLRQAARMLVSVGLSGIAAQLLGLAEFGWALITAVIVTSNSVSSTWQASRDQIVGTLIGAAAGTLAIVLTLHGLPRMAVFAALLVPLALLAAARPTLRLTCVTLIVVFLFPSPGGPFERPFNRVVLILIGALVSLLVSYVVFRPRARAGALMAAAAMLRILHDRLAGLLSAQAADTTREQLGDTATASLRALADAVAEARHEHVGALEEIDPLLVRLVPMLRRLQSDVLFVTRALDALSDRTACEAALRSACIAFCQVFDGLGQRCEAIADGRPAPWIDRAGPEIAALDASLAALGDTALGNAAGVPVRFTLEMLRRDLDDMQTALCDDRLARPAGPG